MQEVRRTFCRQLYGDLTPLEAIAGQVPATIDGKFPEKYMKKKAVVTVTPVLKYEGGEAKGQSATFQGEKCKVTTRLSLTRQVALIR